MDPWGTPILINFRNFSDVAEPDRNTPKIGPRGTTLEFTATEFMIRKEAQKYRLFRLYFGSR